MKFANANKLDRNTGEAHHRFLLINQLKAIETYHFRPRYAGANLGHPSSFYGVLLGSSLCAVTPGYAATICSYSWPEADGKSTHSV